MAEPLKYVYNEAFFDKLSAALKSNVDGFQMKKFITQLQSDGWEDLELKERMRRLSMVLRNHLDSDYETSLKQIFQTIESLRTDDRDVYGFEYMFFPDYIEVFGQDDYKTSIKAFTTVTQFTSCEFAVRPYIKAHPKLMYEQMMVWAKHKAFTVRRLASEGFRPRLPWAMALPNLKHDPSPLFSMLQLLKDDSSETVRRSVANNLNDISKDHPDLVIQLTQKWIGKTTETDKLLKHACRTLLKQGNSKAMALFGLGYNKNIKVHNVNITHSLIHVGDYLEFDFKLENASSKEILVRLEYAIYYQKANGSLTKKVYKISEKEYAGSSTVSISRKQSFKPISTRTFHSGLHQLAIVVNGTELEKINFHLKS